MGACVAPLVILLFAAVSAHSQTVARDRRVAPLTGTAGINGVVVSDDDRMTPIRGAIVTIQRVAEMDTRTAATDSQGRFAFVGLPSGTYTLSAAKAAYVSTNYGALQTGMPGSAIPLRDAQNFAANPIPLTRGAVIAGRVSDRHARPIGNALVSAVQVAVVDGQRRARAGAAYRRTTVTNGHGDYRLFGLPAGEYIIYAEVPRDQMLLREVSPALLEWAQDPARPRPADQRQVTYAPTVYPGTAVLADATPIIMARGEERDRVDFQLQSIPVVRLSGFVIDPDGQPAARVTVTRQVKQPDAVFPGLGTTAVTDAAGAFTFHAVPPGNFVLLARSNPSTGPPLWGRTEVNVLGEHVEDREIRLRPGMSLRGRVVFNGRDPAEPKPRVTVALSPGERPTSRDVPGTSDGSFAIDGVIPGSFRFVATVASPSWTVRSIIHAGRDLADLPLEIREGDDLGDIVVALSQTMASVTGTLTDGAGQPASQLYVFMFPVSRTFWTKDSRRVRVVRTDVSGTYSITGLPSGEYYLAAATAVDATLQYEPSYLELFVPGAIRIDLGDGERRNQDLRVGDGLTSQGCCL